jgi:hypothetical protein
VSVQETDSMPDVNLVASEILEPIKGKLKHLLFYFIERIANFLTLYINIAYLLRVCSSYFIIYAIQRTCRRQRVNTS